MVVLTYDHLSNIMSYACHYPGARMSVSDGTLTIVAKNQAVMEKVLEKVNLTFN